MASKERKKNKKKGKKKSISLNVFFFRNTDTLWKVCFHTFPKQNTNNFKAVVQIALSKAVKGGGQHLQK